MSHFFHVFNAGNRQRSVSVSNDTPFLKIRRAQAGLFRPITDTRGPDEMSRQCSEPWTKSATPCHDLTSRTSPARCDASLFDHIWQSLCSLCFSVSWFSGHCHILSFHGCDTKRKDATTEDVDGPEERQWKPPLPSELRARREVVSLQPDQATVPDQWTKWT